MHRNVLLVLALLTLLCGAPPVAVADDGFFAELFAPWDHIHESPLGTPYVHTFFFEPAFLDRDLHLDYFVTNNAEGTTDEQEFELELEWALSERLQFVVEAPLIATDPVAEPNVTGFGDLAAMGRVMLVRRPRFLLTANMEVEAPTASVASGLGRGELAVAPSFSFWLDLGRWTTLQGQFGPEFGLESGESELKYGFALTRSWCGPVLCPRLQHRHGRRHHHAGHHSNHGGTIRLASYQDDHGDHVHEHDHDHGSAEPEDAHYHSHNHRNGHHDHPHRTPGLTTLILETSGVQHLNAEEPTTHFELTTGLSYVFNDRWIMRTGVRFPLHEPQRLDCQYIFSALLHF